jgi:hypothetical protein
VSDLSRTAPGRGGHGAVDGAAGGDAGSELDQRERASGRLADARGDQVVLEHQRPREDTLELVEEGDLAKAEVRRVVDGARARIDQARETEAPVQS